MDRSTYIIVRGSLRIRSFTPWSANERERKVDSIMPGKFLGGDTGEGQRLATTRAVSKVMLTSESV